MSVSTSIDLRDAVPGSLTIRKVGPLFWHIKQSSWQGNDSDNAQNPMWLHIHNTAKPRKISLKVQWATPGLSNYRRLGYQKIKSHYLPCHGTLEGEHTHYHFRIPRGTSSFGFSPWYSNEDAERFMKEMVATSPLCKVRIIGQTHEGRDIPCLTIGRAKKGSPKHNFVILSRIHGNETPGSFGVEGTVREILLNPKAKQLLNKYTFHIFPCANPDGIAHGWKHTRAKADRKFNLSIAPLGSKDSTIQAIRNEVLALHPVCTIDHHSYFDPMPMAIVFNKQDAVIATQELLDDDPKGNGRLYLMLHRLSSKPWWFMLHELCHRRFNTSVLVTELTWSWDRLPSDLEKLGVRFFWTAIKALQNKA